MAAVHASFYITDIDRSVLFYTALGFEETGRFTLPDDSIRVFLAHPDDGEEPRSAVRPDLRYSIELAHAAGEQHEMGSAFRHIGVSAPDLDRVLERLAEQGVEPDWHPLSLQGVEGFPRICFVRDPDGYVIELLDRS